jgi:hypothetical protein
MASQSTTFLNLLSTISLGVDFFFLSLSLSFSNGPPITHQLGLGASVNGTASVNSNLVRLALPLLDVVLADLLA